MIRRRTAWNREKGKQYKVWDALTNPITIFFKAEFILLYSLLTLNSIIYDDY